MMLKYSLLAAVTALTFSISARAQQQQVMPFKDICKPDYLDCPTNCEYYGNNDLTKLRWTDALIREGKLSRTSQGIVLTTTREAAQAALKKVCMSEISNLETQKQQGQTAQQGADSTSLTNNKDETKLVCHQGEKPKTCQARLEAALKAQAKIKNGETKQNSSNNTAEIKADRKPIVTYGSIEPKQKNGQPTKSIDYTETDLSDGRKSVKFKTKDFEREVVMDENGKKVSDKYFDSNGKEISKNKAYGMDSKQYQDLKKDYREYKRQADKAESDLDKTDELDPKANEDRIANEGKNQSNDNTVSPQLKEIRTGQGYASCAPTESTSILNSLTKIEAAKAKYDVKIKTCAEKTARSKQVCTVVRSPYVQIGMLLANGLTASIGGSSDAEKTCEASATTNNIIQGLATGASAICLTETLLCQSSCGSARKLLQEIQDQLSSIATNFNTAATNVACVESGASATLPTYSSGAIQLAQSFGAIKTETVENGYLASCKESGMKETEIANLAVNMGAAVVQAKKCKDNLAATNNPTSGSNMGALCSDPTQAMTNPQCRCLANPTAQGCPGYQGGSAGGVINKSTGNGGNMMASKQGGANNFKSNSRFGNGLGKDASDTNPWGGVAGGGAATDGEAGGFGAGSASAGGGGGSGGGSGAADPAQAAAGHGADGKMNTGSFKPYGGVGLPMGSKGAAGGMKNSQQYKDAVLRKIASDEAQRSISPATGYSNWDKVKNRYKETKSTLIGN